MQSRMDRYNNVDSTNTQAKSRTQRNQSLYEKIKTSDIKRHDLSNNMSVIDGNIKSIDINKVHNFLDEKYGDNTAKRRSIDLPEIDENVEVDPIMDTKEYDINAIIEKAKQGKNIDYSKERLKKVREAQFEILNNLDSEIQNLSSLDRAKEKRKQQEENLKELINTITEIELQNKMKDTSSDFDLLSDLMDDAPTKEVEETQDLTLTDSIKIEPIEEEKTEEVKVDTKPNIVIGGVQQEENTINNKVVTKEETKEDKKEENKKLEDTLNKLDIDSSTYEEFADINEKDKSSIILKVVIFVVFVVLILGGVYILNNLLGLGLLPF